MAQQQQSNPIAPQKIGGIKKGLVTKMIKPIIDKKAVGMDDIKYNKPKAKKTMPTKSMVEKSIHKSMGYK